MKFISNHEDLKHHYVPEFEKTFSQIQKLQILSPKKQRVLQVPKDFSERFSFIFDKLLASNSVDFPMQNASNSFISHTLSKLSQGEVWKPKIFF